MGPLLSLAPRVLRGAVLGAAASWAMAELSCERIPAPSLFALLACWALAAACWAAIWGL